FDHERGDLGGDDAEGGFRHTEFGRRAGDGQVGDAGQAEAAAHDGAFGDGDDDFGGFVDLLDHLAEGAVEFVERVVAAFAGFLAPGAGHVFDIAAGAEVSTCAADDGCANAGV